jgi:predicted dehydrogenase
MSIEPVKVGVIGCGNISSAYLEFARQFDILKIEALADLDIERARAQAQRFGVPTACSAGQLLKRDDIEIVLNLTTPQVHYKVAMAAIKAGKHVYNEKPLCEKRAQGRKLLAAADEAGLRVGCAPDTVLGGGHQTARKLIDDGAIGQPVAATAFMTCRGHESWHPDPEFYYKLGGGPMMDMGPYYLTDLTMLLGPIRRVTASAQVLINPRTITSQKKYGTQIEVETPDHVAGTLDFECGAVGTIITTFAVWTANLPRIEIYGTEGSISVPDPNGFGGTVRLYKPATKEWHEVELTHGYTTNTRSLGLADMAMAIRTGRRHRASGRQAYHVLDVMHGLLEASRKGRHYQVPSTFERPEPMAPGLNGGRLA